MMGAIKNGLRVSQAILLDMKVRRCKLIGLLYLPINALLIAA